MAFFKLAPKMFRACLVILFLHLGFVFQGCAVLEYLDGSSKEEIRSFRKTGGGMPNEPEKLRSENLKLKKRINTLEKLRDENRKELARTRDQKDFLNERINALKQEKQRIHDKNKITAKKLTMLQPKPEKDIRKLKIKLLSGDGDLNSAKEMARKLRNMGFVIKFIDRAPRSNFLQNTVYFAPNFKDDAKSLASSLGGNTICKPLTWFSIFDLIVVTGKN